MTNNDNRKDWENMLDELGFIHPPLHKFIASLLAEERKKVIEEAVVAVKEHEIRSDDGGDYMTGDTELMREEIIQTLCELKEGRSE